MEKTATIIIKTSQSKRPDSGSAGVSKNLSPIPKPNEVSTRFTDDAMDGCPERFSDWLKVTQPGSWLQSHSLDPWGGRSKGVRINRNGKARRVGARVLAGLRLGLTRCLQGSGPAPLVGLDFIRGESSPLGN